MRNYSKSAKRRAKKAKADLPQLADTPKREPNGRPSRAGKFRDQGAETLKARARHMGKEITNKNLRDMQQPWWGCCAGRVIGQTTMGEKERRQLWDAIQHMRKVVVQHDAALGLPKRHAVCMNLLTATGDSAKPKDSRTDEERQRQATAALMQVEGWLSYTDKAAQSEAKRVVLHDELCVDEAGLLSALRCVADGVAGKRMVYRGRS